MGFLFILLFGILAILLIAKTASKVKPKEELTLEKRLIQKDIEATSKDASDDEASDEASDGASDKIEALTSLLIRKEVISEEELLIEIAGMITHKVKH